MSTKNGLAGDAFSVCVCLRAINTEIRSKIQVQLIKNKSVAMAAENIIWNNNLVVVEVLRYRQKLGHQQRKCSNEQLQISRNGGIPHPALPPQACIGLNCLLFHNIVLEKVMFYDFRIIQSSVFTLTHVTINTKCHFINTKCHKTKSHKRGTLNDTMNAKCHTNTNQH